jgi:hypothetical protein
VGASYTFAFCVPITLEERISPRRVRTPRKQS